MDLTESGPEDDDGLDIDDILSIDEEFVDLSDVEDDDDVIRICSNTSECSSDSLAPKYPSKIETDQDTSACVNARTDLPLCLVQCLQRKWNLGKAPHQYGLNTSLISKREHAIMDMSSLREVNEEEVVEFLKHGLSRLCHSALN